MSIDLDRNLMGKHHLLISLVIVAGGFEVNVDTIDLKGLPL